MNEARKELPAEIQYVQSIDEAVKDADAIVLMTEWNQYRGLNLAKLRSSMRGNVFVDLRNVYAQATTSWDFPVTAEWCKINHMHPPLYTIPPSSGSHQTPSVRPF